MIELRYLKPQSKYCIRAYLAVKDGEHDEPKQQSIELETHLARRLSSKDLHLSHDHLWHVQNQQDCYSSHLKCINYKSYFPRHQPTSSGNKLVHYNMKVIYLNLSQKEQNPSQEDTHEGEWVVKNLNEKKTTFD